MQNLLKNLFKTRAMQLPARLLLVASMGLLLLGCSHYRLGNANELPYSKIFVKAVKNDSFAPQAQGLLSTQLRQRISEEPRIRVVDSIEEADAVLETTLTGYSQSTAATKEDESALGRGFTGSLTASYKVTEVETGKQLFSGSASGSATVLIDGGPIASRHQSMPIITDSIAQSIKNNITNIW